MKYMLTYITMLLILLSVSIWVLGEVLELLGVGHYVMASLVTHGVLMIGGLIYGKIKRLY